MPSISASGRGGQPGTWMSTGHDLVDALEHRVVVEHPARERAGAHRDHPLGLEHLVVDLAERRRHLVRHAARDDQQVGLARRRAEPLHPEARDVVARRDDRHHLDRAAGEAERVGPDRVGLRPGDRLLDRRESRARPRSSRAPARRRPGPRSGQSVALRAEPGLRERAVGDQRELARLVPLERSLAPDVDVGDGRGSRRRRGTRRTRTSRARRAAPRAGTGRRSRCRRG